LCKRYWDAKKKDWRTAKNSWKIITIK
jgi:hypothetical protein